MPFHPAPALKPYPFVRLVFALISGIALSWYLDPSFNSVISIGIAVACLVAAFSLMPESKRFALHWLRGCLILLLFAWAGMLLTWRQNIENNSSWFGQVYKPGDPLLLTIEEPLDEKPKSYKAVATVNAVYASEKSWSNSEGKVLLYFEKDSAPQIDYGSQIIVRKPLQEIQNSGNPAALDYKRYCLFQGITHQAFLSRDDYTVLPNNNGNLFRRFLFLTRNAALRTIQKNIHSQKELGIAEALLIGYRNDLDKDVVQAYSDTGVVHIIAISGLHIGVIYSLLVALFSIVRSSRFKKWFQPVLILLVIWGFTLLAGAAPSISRAAVMFTCVLFGKLLARHGNVYNTLAASAFILLAWNPFYLWDVGFQLSYAAVLSISLFFNPLYKLLYIRNKMLRMMWQLTALTTSAQILALPLVVFHFHQFPLLFLLSNLVAVPLSSFILFGELLLFCFSWLPAAASFIGDVLQFMIGWMNSFIEHIDRIPFSVADGLHVLIWQFFLLYFFIIGCSTWLFRKTIPALIAAMASLITFFILVDVNSTYHKQQQKLVIYNVPHHSAIDFISGSACSFAGDSVVLADASIRNFNLKAANIRDHVYNAYFPNTLPNVNDVILQFGPKKVVLLDCPLSIPAKVEKKIPVDVIVICRNANISMTDLQALFDVDQIVVDGSNSQWKTAQWKKDCEQLHLRFHSVASDGAFTMKI